MNPMSRSFVAKLEAFVGQGVIALVQFRKGERKDTVMAEHLRKFAKEEGVLFVGVAREKTPVFRGEKRRMDQSHPVCRHPSLTHLLQVRRL
jgi:hypothetical protein